MIEKEILVYQKILLDEMAQPGNDVLDVGFGWGVTSKYLYEKGVKSLSIIEKRSDIAKRANEWAADKPNVTVYEGDWKSVIPELSIEKIQFDAIYMDTFCPEGEDFRMDKTEEEYREMLNYFYVTPTKEEESKYASFEPFSKAIAKENCILSLYEYSKYRKLADLNFYYADTPWMVDGFPSTHRICWTYFVAGEWRKNKFYDIQNDFLPTSLCNKIIEENKDNLEYFEREAVIDDIVHQRKFYFTSLKYNEELEDILNDTIFRRFKKVSLKDLMEGKGLGLYKYEIGQGYDRHVESRKGIPLDNPDQYNEVFEVALNNIGTTQIYDDWRVNDRITFSTNDAKTGQMLNYKTWQHVSYNKVTEGTRYQLLLFTRNKDYKNFLI